MKKDITKELLKDAWLLTGPWILYDGSCRICTRGAVSFGPMLRRRGFRLETLQGPIGRHFAHDGTDEMKVVTCEGRLLGGAAAIAHICGFIWWAKPFQWIWHIPLCRPPLRRAYAWVARHRHCTAQSCPPSPPK